MKKITFIITLLLSLLDTTIAQIPKFEFIKSFDNIDTCFVYSSAINDEVLYLATYFINDTILLNDLQESKKQEYFLTKGSYILKIDTDGIIRQTIKICQTPLQVSAISITDNKNIYLAANFSDSLILNDNESTTLESNGETDIAIIRIDENGNIIKKCAIGGSQTDRVFDIHIGADNNIFICGSLTGEVDIDPGNTIQKVSYNTSFQNGFILNLDKDLNYLWHSYFYQHNGIATTALTSDKQGNLLATGIFSGRLKVNNHTEIISINSKPTTDIFYTKLSPSGDIIWIKNLNLVQEDATPIVNNLLVASDLTLDADNNIYISGFISPSQLRMKDPFNSSGPNHPIVLKLSPEGELNWLKELKEFSGLGKKIAIDSLYNIILAGTGNYVNETNMSSDNTYLSYDNSNSFFSDNKTSFLLSIDTSGYQVWHKNILSRQYIFMKEELSPPTFCIDAENNIYCIDNSSRSEQFTTNGHVDSLNNKGTFNIGIRKLSQCFPTYNTVYETACNSYTDDLNREFTNSGTYYETTLRTGKCDSITIHHVSVLYPYYIKRDTFVCRETGFLRPDTLISFANTKANYTYYTEDLTTKYGNCDSTIEWHVIFLPSYNTTEYINLCEGDYFQIDGFSFSEDTIYKQILTSYNTGCDSVVNWDIQFSSSYYLMRDTTLCENQTFYINNTPITESGQYEEHFICKNSGCDSIINWNITFNPTYYLVKDTTLYEGSSMTVAGKSFYKNETYIENFDRKNTGCDSTIQWEINVSDTITFDLQQPDSACPAEDMQISIKVKTGLPTTYQLLFESKAINSGFRDSNYKPFHLNDQEGTITIPIPENSPAGNYTGYLQLKNDNGTLSQKAPFFFTIKLSASYIHKLSNDIIACNNSLNQFEKYQWYKNGQQIKGATQQYYCDPEGLSGNYALKAITPKGDTLTTCDKFFNIVLLKHLTLSPNPIKQDNTCQLQLHNFTSEDLTKLNFSLANVEGDVVLNQSITDTIITIKASFDPGVYIGRLSNPARLIYPFKLIITEN